MKLESKQFCIDLVILQRKFTGQKLLDQTYRETYILLVIP